MKHRVLAFICALALVIGMIPAGIAKDEVVVVAAAATATAAEEATYDVGYSSKNLNPWVSSDFDVATDVGTAEFLADPENTADKKIYPNFFSQNGNQIDWDSVVTQLHDDNGDGSVDHGDGIFATCTAVTYGKGTADEKTVLFITTDTMKAWTALVNEVRNKITESEWGKELGITADQIMVCSNHTHSGPALSGLSGFVNSYIDSTVFDTDEKIAALKTDRTNYYNWVIDRIVATAEESVADQAPATMSKGSVNATEATAAKGYNSGKGYHMNAIRHYERTLTSSLLWWTGEVSSIYANTSTPSHDKLVAQLKEYNHEAKNIFNYQDNYTTSWSTTDDADNNMYVLRFEFEDSTKEPVVFVNWRAHSTMNSGILSHSVLSGDYATGLRQALADEGYRAAFFQGAAGNVVPHPTSNVYTVDGKLVKDKMDWLYEATNKNDAALSLDSTKKTFIYGRMLAEIAQYCMEETDNMVNTPVGKIGTYKTSWKAEQNKYSQALLEAAIALRTEVMSAKGWDLATFESNYRVHFNDNSATYFPYYYKPNGTTEAILNSRLHFNTVYTQAKTVIDDGKTVSNYTGAVELDAIMLGKNVAFITSPNELADYYHDFTGDVVSHTTAEKEAHNDWFNLKDDAYGMPFVLGYANQNSGYIAGWLDHQANSETHSTITGLGADGYMLYSPGTYESMTSSFAAGQGEELIKVYDRMLFVAAARAGQYDENAPCQHCSPDEDVTWKPLLAEDSNTAVGAGHYYLYEDLAGTGMNGQWAVGTAAAPQETCIDLWGHTKFSQSRNFNVPNGSTLNIMDSKGGGEIHSQTFSNNPGGGNFSIGSGATVNLYGGTLSFTKLDNTSYYGVGIGGVVSLQGTLNMYGGTIEGADLVNSSYKGETGAYFANNGCGGAVYVYGSGKLNVYGGTITSGSVPETVTTGTVDTPKESVGKGPCVFLADAGSRVTVSGNAFVEDIYYNKKGGACLTVSGAYTGTTALTFDSSITITDNLDVGNSSGANLAGATITCTNNPLAEVYVQGTNLLLSNVTENTTAMAYNTDGKKWAYDNLDAAADAYTNGYIQLTKDQTAAATIEKNVYLDLAGHNVTGEVTVSNGYTLYAMDSNTNDYTVKDGKGYGKITNHSGDIAGVPEEADCAADGYLMVDEDGALSFHSVNLQLYAMTLRAKDANGECAPGVYYKSYFKGDEVVAGEVQAYGVALSVQAVPDEENLDSKCLYSVFDTSEEGIEFKAGSAGNEGNGTLLKGIMKATNMPLINARNANMEIYGRAYILTEDGYMFGTSVYRSLKEQTQLTDDKWNTLSDEQKAAIIQMYNTYSAVMKNWDIPNIIAAAQ